jgi:hypothetical protein
MWEKIALVLLANVGLVVLFIIYRVLRRLFLRWQATKDRSYNVFDRVQLSRLEKLLMKRWQF